MTYRFLAIAEQELDEAIAFYESASPGLGLELLDEVERTIKRILRNPDAWAIVSEKQRRCRTRRFPYGLIYHHSGNEILVAAFMHL